MWHTRTHTHTHFSEAIFVIKTSQFSRYTPRCNLIYVHEKKTAFSAPYVTEVRNNQQHYVRISCIEFRAKRTINVPGTRVGTLIVATIYLQLIQNRYMFRSFTVLQCSHQHCLQPVARNVEVVGYL